MEQSDSEATLQAYMEGIRVELGLNRGSDSKIWRVFNEVRCVIDSLGATEEVGSTESSSLIYFSRCIRDEIEKNGKESWKARLLLLFKNDFVLKKEVWFLELQ